MITGNFAVLIRALEARLFGQARLEDELFFYLLFWMVVGAVVEVEPRGLHMRTSAVLWSLTSSPTFFLMNHMIII